ncbi:MAG: SDR family NAD(P)-dependent oxidoreductase, partial [Gammaproteobacteria bacterium]
MNLNLGEKTALITGSTASIGYATALRLAREGADVVVNGRSQERVDNAVATLKEQCPDAGISGIAADLSSREGVYHL